MAHDHPRSVHDVPLASRYCGGCATITAQQWLDHLLHHDPHAKATVDGLERCGVPFDVLIIRDLKCATAVATLFHVFAYLRLDTAGLVVHRLVAGAAAPGPE